MSLYLLDTDMLTLLQHQNPAVLAQIAAHPTDTVGITIVTVEEQLSGRLAMVRRATIPADVVVASELLGATVESLAGFPLHYHTTNSLAIFDQLVARKLNVKRMDLRIASIALDANAVIVTRNRRDFNRIARLQIEDWSV